MSERESTSGGFPDTLSMENELLSFENSFLKGRAEEYQQRTQKAEAARTQLEQKLKEAQQNVKEAQRNAMPAGERERLELAYSDIVLLLRRINRSPAGPLLRQRPAFRQLVNRYLG